MAGSSDYLLSVVIESLEAYGSLVRTRIRAIPGIASIESSFAFGSVKQTRVYPPPRYPAALCGRLP